MVTSCETVRHGMCSGNSKWTSLWCSTIWKTWNSNLHRYLLSHHCLYSSLHRVDIYGWYTNPCRPRSPDLPWSWKTHHMARSCSLWLRNSSTARSVLSDAELDNPNACKLLHHYLFPHNCMLGASFQVRIRKSWSCSGHGSINVVKRDHPRFVHEVLTELWKDSCSIVDEDIWRSWSVFPPCNSFFTNGLVINLSLSLSDVFSC